MDEIRDLWSEDVDVTEMGDADFEGRSVGRPASDMGGIIEPIAEISSDHWDLSVNEAMDAVVRIYIAHLIDSGQLDVSREEYNISFLIPPEGWTETLDRPLFKVNIDREKDAHTLSLPYTVDNLIDEAHQQGVVENKSQLVVLAHAWLCEIDNTSEEVTNSPKSRTYNNSISNNSLDKRNLIAGNPTSIGKLCVSKQSRRMLRYFLTLGMTEGEVERRVTDIIEDEGVGTSRTTFNKHVDVFVEMGIVERLGEKRYIRYKPDIESEPFQKLVETDDLLRSYTSRDVGGEVGSALTDLYGGQSRRILTDYFIRLGVESCDDELMSKSDIERETGVARKTTIDNIDVLVEYGILYEDTEFSYSRYRPDPDSDTFNGIVHVDELC